MNKRQFEKYVKDIDSIKDIQKRWKEQLVYSDWYIKLKIDIEARLYYGYHKKEMLSEQDALLRKVWKNIINIVEEYYRNKRIPIGNCVLNLDKERKEIDTVIIHHTSISENSSWQRISAIDLIWVYAREFLDPRRNY